MGDLPSNFLSRPDYPVKIGYSAGDGAERLAGLQTAHFEDLRVIAEIKDGNHALERRLHRLFVSDRVKREWFRSSERLDSLMAIAKSGSAAVIDWLTEREREEAERKAADRAARKVEHKSHEPSESRTMENLLKTRQAAERLGLSKSTLDRFRCRGGGPIYKKLVGSVRYSPSDLDAWSSARVRVSTSDVAGGVA